MSFGSFIAKILHPASGNQVGMAVISTGQHAVALFAATPEGAAVIADIKAAKDPSMTTFQKFEAGVAATAPVLLSIAANPSMVLADFESLAREVVQTFFNAEVSTVAAKAAEAVIAALQPKASAAA